MKKIILFTILMVSGIGSAQSNYNKIPLTPNAASIAQYGDVPIGLYSGTAQYSLPLYTVQGRNLSVPITLNYATNGVKVEDVASWVGTGWSLDAGGVITRNVKDKPDEQSTDTPIDLSASNSCLTPEVSQKLEGGLNDIEFDLFTYSFMGNSGKFIIVNGEAKLIENNGFKIQVMTTDFDEFIITDNSGIKYYFGGTPSNGSVPIEETRIGENGLQIRTAWYLKRMEHWGGEKIEFIYAGGTFNTPYQIGFSQSRSKSIITEDGCAVCPLPDISWSAPGPVESSTYRNNNIQLTSIYCSDLYDRVDFYGSYKELDRMEGKTKTIDFTITSPADHRRYLKKVQFKSLAATVGEIFEFEYDTENIVPARDTFKRDYMGYYNGTNNSYLVTGNHTPKLEHAKNGALTKIKYPTGGHTIINYELHSLPVGGPDCTGYAQFPAPELSHWVIGGYNSYNGDEYQFEVFNITDATFTLSQEYTVAVPDINGVTIGSATFRLKYPNGDLYEFPQPPTANAVREFTRHLTPGVYTLSVSVRSHIYRAISNVRLCNQQTGSSAYIYFPGLRVKSIDNYTSEGELATSKSYGYGTFERASPQTISTAYITAVDTNCGTVIGGVSIPPDYIPFCMRTVHSSTGPLTASGAANEIFYNDVTEYGMEGQTRKYAIKHHFISAPYKLTPSPILSCDLVENAATEYFGKPYEDKTEYYKITDTGEQLLKKTVEYEYENSLTNLESYYSCLRTTKTAGAFAYDNPLYEYTNCIINFIPIPIKMRLGMYKYVRFWQKLVSQKTEEREYSSSNLHTGTITSVSKFYYDNFTHKQVTRQENTTSETLSGGSDINKTEKINYTYADDVTSVSSLYGGTISSDNLAAINNMKSTEKHIISTPLQVEKLDHDGTHLETKRYAYKLHPHGAKVLPLLEKEQSLKGTVSSTNVMNTQFTFSNYNLNNLKPHQIFTNTSDDPTVYIYGYNNMYTIAIIKNQLYNESMYSIIKVLSNEWDYSGSAFQTLYTQLSGISNIMFTLFEHQPLIGVSAIIDTKGKKTAYEYDTFGRLKAVKDTEGNILSENQYNYRTN